MSARVVRPAARAAVAALALGALWLAPATAWSQTPGAAGTADVTGAATAAPPIVNSPLDDRLLYQLLVAEIALARGDASTAYDWTLDAARRTRDEALFRRAVDIALRSRAGDQALVAARAWRTAQPASLDALRLQLQILLAIGRKDGLAEPLRALLALTPAVQRPATILSLPRFLQRANDQPLVASLLEDTLKPYRQDAATRVPVRLTLARSALDGGDAARALALLREAQAVEPASPLPALFALEMLPRQPDAEPLVRASLAASPQDATLRLGYGRVLAEMQRLPEAAEQIEAATKLRPQDPAPYLTLGALRLELKQGAAGEAALTRFLELAQPAAAEPAAAGGNDDAAAGGSANPSAGGSADAAAGDGTATIVMGTGATDDDGDAGDDTAASRAWPREVVQARLMLAQAAEQRGDFAAAEAWLAPIDDPQRVLDVQARRASMLARQGRLAQARELIRATPERRTEDARAKFFAEAALLREAGRWGEAYDVLGEAAGRFVDDVDVLYEQSMMAEKAGRLGEMEQLLRRVIAIKPDHAHAHNALGYSLADRGLRLPEARQLIARALELMPGDPFITDSLGWVEFRLGRADEALRLLQQAYAARPDTEIGAHLGEVLWSLGRRDEALRVWREAGARDGANALLREVLTRLRVQL